MYSISLMPYLDNDKYIKIFTINELPADGLKKYCRRINPPKLSPFTEESKCIIAFTSIAYPNRLMQLDELTDLMHILQDNKYEINYSFSKLIRKTEALNNKDIMFYIYKS